MLLRTRLFIREMIESSPKLKVIARHGVGKDNVDLDAAEEACVVVTTAPRANRQAVAERLRASAGAGPQYH